MAFQSQARNAIVSSTSSTFSSRASLFGVIFFDLGLKLGTIVSEGVGKA